MRARYLAGAAGAMSAAALLRRRGRCADLEGAVAVVTGGSSGLGLAMARELVAAGAAVAICGRDADTLASAGEELRSMGATVHAGVCDVGSREDVEAFVAEVTGAMGPIEVLVNNAGEIDVGEVGADEHETFARMLDIMFWGVVHPTLAVLPAMRERGSGRIATITSIGARVSPPHLVPYACAKHAAYAFSEGLRAEVGGEGVSLTTVVPGLMHTGSHRAARVKGGRRAEYGWFALLGAGKLTASSPERAAARVVQGLRRGAPHVVIGLDAALAMRIQAIAPGSAGRLLALADRALPDTSEADTHRSAGWQLETPLTRSPITRAGRRSAADLQQHRGGAAPS